MNLAFIFSSVSRKVLQIYPFRFNIIFLSFLFIYSTISYSQSLSAEQIYKKVSGAVVVIHAYNDNDELAAQGSGVVLNDIGYVVTNYHVLSGNKRLEILHGKENIPYVDMIGIDVEKDILILKIEPKKFPSVKIGNSNSLNIGQRVYAIGSPMGFENSISEGIISGLRSYNDLRRNFIQITASISPGSSGGAIVNDKGELIGISTLTMKEGQNLNFAIPIEDILKVEISSYSKNDKYKDFDLFKKGYDATEKGDYQEGIKYYSLYIIKYPNDIAAYYNRGLAKNTLGNYSGAMEDFNNAIDINPNFADAYWGRGGAKHLLEDYQGAIQDYNKAIEINPNFAEAYLGRGGAKYLLENYQGAIQDYNKAIEINPYFAEAYVGRGMTKDILKDDQGAILDYNKAAEIDPKYAKTSNLIAQDKVKEYQKNGMAKYKLSDYKGAIQDYNKAIEIDPNYEDAYKGRGLAKYYLSDYRGAIQDFNNAIEINPKDAGAYLSRGIAKYNLGDNNGACLDWSKAGELGNSEVYDMIKKHCGN